MVFAAVAGHLQSLEFTDQYKKWHGCAPVELYTAPVVKFVPEVCCSESLCYSAPCKFSKGLGFSPSHFAVDVVAVTPYSKLSLTKSPCNICSFQQGRRFLTMQNLDAHNIYRSKLLR